MLEKTVVLKPFIFKRWTGLTNREPKVAHLLSFVHCDVQF